MNRTEFITVTAAILFAAFVLGWLACWLVQRLTRPARSDAADLDRMAQQLHQAEEARDQATALLSEREDTLSRRIDETETELTVAMDGLRESRTEIEQLRDFIELKLARR